MKNISLFDITVVSPSPTSDSAWFHFFKDVLLIKKTGTSITAPFMSMFFRFMYRVKAF